MTIVCQAGDLTQAQLPSEQAHLLIGQHEVDALTFQHRAVDRVKTER